MHRPVFKVKSGPINKLLLFVSVSTQMAFSMNENVYCMSNPLNTLVSKENRLTNDSQNMVLYAKDEIVKNTINIKKQLLSLRSCATSLTR